MQGRKLERNLLFFACFVLFVSPLHQCSGSQSYISGSRNSNKKQNTSPSSKAQHSVPKKNHSSPSSKDSYKNHGNSRIFDVLSFGAKGDGVTDDSKAFQAAWQAACIVASSVVEVPSEFQFLVGPISFSGPCQPNIVFQIDGTIVAPKNPHSWGSGILFQWILFTKLKSVKVQGSGTIDGRGSKWWKATPAFDIDYGDYTEEKWSGIKPTALRFYGSIGVHVAGITIQNSPQCHLKFDNCITVEVSNITVSSPWNSPNTDGVHLQNSQDVHIHHSSMACGDDCISIQTGCSNVRIHNINCGPGHGISIGGLGKDETKACVSNISVHDSVIRDSLNGVRIKTWQGGQGLVKEVQFTNIDVWNVTTAVVIDQFYCDKPPSSSSSSSSSASGNCACQNSSEAVAITGVKYRHIRGTYAWAPVHLACSDTVPCIGVLMSKIKLKPMQMAQQVQTDSRRKPFCWNSYGYAQKSSIPPILCLSSGQPNSHRIQSSSDAC